MQGQEAKRNRTPRRFDVVVVPSGEGSKPVRFSAGWWRIGLVAAAVFLACVAITLAILMFTPAMEYLPIPNPALEARYGRQLLETQQQLQALAEDVILLRDYNNQLRHALGQDGTIPVSDGRTQDTGRVVMEPPTPQERGLTPVRMSASRAGDVTGDAPAVFTAGGITHPGPEGRRLDLPLLLPAEGFVSQGFDRARRHLGMDIAGKRGMPVHAPADGFVVYAGWSYEDGNTLVLSHGSGYMTVYKHCQTNLVAVASAVRRGDVIALLGGSGQTSQGPHLHFEVWKDGVPQDPNLLLMTPARMQ